MNHTQTGIVARKGSKHRRLNTEFLSCAESQFALARMIRLAVLR